jgi:hypothetical protein
MNERTLYPDVAIELPQLTNKSEDVLPILGKNPKALITCGEMRLEVRFRWVRME